MIFKCNVFFSRIEWDGMDYDSGLNQVEWKLFDKYTGNNIIHGKAQLHAQGMAQVNTTHSFQYNNYLTTLQEKTYIR